MNRKRTVIRNRRKREVYLKKIVIGIFLLVLTVGTAASVLSNNFVMAEDSVDRSIEVKYYKSIEIESGDTLWDIAKEYKDEHYDSTYDYVDEVMNINHLDSGEIHAGSYLTIPYYGSL